MKEMIKKTVGMMVLFAMTCFCFSGNQVNAAQTASVEYRVHMQSEGWKGYVSNGTTGGTTGKSLRMEAIKIRIKGVNGGIQYQTHLQNVGWTSWKSNDQLSGTTGQSRSMEAIRIKLTGEIAKKYDVYYKAHVGDVGWLGWTKNGGIAGSTGCSMRMEAVQIKLYPKNQGPGISQASNIYKPSLTVQAHVGNVGWQKAVAENAVSGTVGQGKRMEAMIIKCSDFLGGNGIQYRAHVQNIGWQNWCNSGYVSGTTGRSLQMEAIQIRLTGYLGNVYDVYYRVHVGDIGWLGWAKNGDSAGTTGGSKRMEAIQVKLVRKGQGTACKGEAYKNLSVANNMALQAPVPIGCKFSEKENDNGWYGFHDINRGVSTATPVYAIADGTVTYKQAYRIYGGVKKLTSYGNYIEFTSSNGVYQAKYCHLNQFVGNSRLYIQNYNTRQVKGSTGTYNCGSKSVRKGEIIGYVGTTGNSSGVHLHFELRKNNSRIDPVSVIAGLY